MTYLAIARKYRPATFEEIVGQEHVTRTLANAIEGDRIHHAYLFTGARGVGKTTAARALARALNCREGPTPTPCGICTSCVEIAHGTSPDLIEIDGASNNSVEDVREIREAVQYAPRGRWKIYLVDEVHMLSKGAFNALLKTLEEPPPHVAFIFATTEPNKIPDTILSRVQRFDFKRIPVPKVVARLSEIASKEGVEVASTGLRLIARAGEGSMRDAQSLLDQVIAYGGDTLTDDQIVETLGLIDRSLVHAFLGGLVRGEPAACLQVVDRVYSYGHELSVFTEELLEVLRHATFLRLGPDASRFVDLPDDELDALVEAVSEADPEQLSRLFSAILEVHEQVRRAARPRIVLDMAVARLATTRPVQPVHALVGRLEGLERALRGGGGGGGGRRPDRRSGRSGGGGPRRGGAPVADGPNPGGSSGGGPRGGRPSTGRGPRDGGPPRARAGEGPGRADPLGPDPVRRPQVEQAPPSGPPPHEGPEPGAAWATGPDDIPLSELPIVPRTARSAVTTRPGARRSVARRERTPWEAFLADITKRDARLACFERARPVEQDTTLRLVVRPGRALAEIRRFLDHPAVVDALAARYPPGTTIAPEARRGGRIDAATLERDFLADPAHRRIVQTLGAKLESVEPLDDPASDDDAPPRSDA